ncbi:glyoxylate/hydroxypyruvate reductase A [Temperatibacter marinus]|uniref:Glyoxylate/hydroxypyruvate reductase A n=1 Tax=Temperatibacter marinus TaxID=1456591 RepID=A0AA52EBE9_9PROT|nr:glyoxylate/hydroxypyruvate reductase A [Temperatibacter marinus]WND01635.1 glyoxylate/hydroxypyruvate reductase A [Temperatibacter marinus]
MIILCYVEGYDAQIDELYKGFFEKYIPGVDFRAWPNWGDPASFDEATDVYAYVWAPPQGLLAKYSMINAIFSIGAGIDHLTADPLLPKNVPIIRMGDESLKDGMGEYATMAALWFLRDMKNVSAWQKRGEWQHHFPKAPSQFTIGLMGYGLLGKAVAKRLKPFGFKLATWSTSEKDPEEGITHYRGSTCLKDFMANVDMIYALLPQTTETTDLINKTSLRWMKKGSYIVNAGRGNLIDLPTLVDAVKNGHIAGAMLDVFKEEPLPKGDPAWLTEGIIITPHVAAITRPDTSTKFVAETIIKLTKGEKIETMLDIRRGY